MARAGLGLGLGLGLGNRGRLGSTGLLTGPTKYLREEGDAGRPSMKDQDPRGQRWENREKIKKNK